MQSLTVEQQVFIKKPGISEKDNRNILTIICSNEPYNIDYNPLYMISMVAMCLSISKNCINEIATPEQLQ
jgi:hypothetical protein